VPVNTRNVPVNTRNVPVNTKNVPVNTSAISRKEQRLRCPIRELIKISGPKKEERAGENCAMRSLAN